MSVPAPTAPAWLAPARAHARRGACAPRLAFVVNGHAVGSVEPDVLNEIGRQRLICKHGQLQKEEYSGAAAWVLRADDASAALNALAHALRAAGRCGPWRDEQLAVCDAAGARVATIERGAVRVLGIATTAVHLVGTTVDGRMWVQQRAFDKASDPGLWDTLMGGMVSAADTLEQALARETWEEAGLHVAALAGLAHGGHVDFDQPSAEGGGAGYMRERIDWFCATVPDGMAPANQDGEVARFERLTLAQVQDRLAEGSFTREAALVLAQYFGW